MSQRIIGDDLARLVSYTDSTTDPNGCWPFTGVINNCGYGSFVFKGAGTGAHRAAYQIFCGATPRGMHVDHLCHTRENCVGGDGCLHRRCVRPSHLALTTHRDNNLRGHGAPADNVRKTHCPRGHEYTPENTYVRRPISPNATSRACRECKRILARQAYARGKAVN